MQGGLLKEHVITKRSKARVILVYNGIRPEQIGIERKVRQKLYSFTGAFPLYNRLGDEINKEQWKMLDIEIRETTGRFGCLITEKFQDVQDKINNLEKMANKMGPQPRNNTKPLKLSNVDENEIEVDGRRSNMLKNSHT